MLLSLHYNRCEFNTVQASVVYWLAGVTGHSQSRWAEAVCCGSIYQAAARLCSPNDRCHFRILDSYRSENTCSSKSGFMWLLSAQSCASMVTVSWAPSSKGWADMEHDIDVILTAAFSYWSSIDSDISLGWLGWAAPAPKTFVSQRWHSRCAGSHRFKAFRKEENMVGMEQNELFNGNAKWVYMVQRRACSGFICS